MCVCVGLWWSLYFQELLLQLHDLPFALLGMIGEFDGDSEQGEAASALQTALKRHVVNRCEDPRHTARTNTPAKAPCCATSVLSQASEGCQMLGDTGGAFRPYHRQAWAEKEGACVGVAVKVEEPNHLWVTVNLSDQCRSRHLVK